MLIFLIIFLLGLGGVVFYFFRRRKIRRKISDLLRLKLFLVRLPINNRGGKEERGKDFKQEINVSEQLFAALASFKKPFIFEIAVPYVGQEICFYMAVPSSLGESAVRQIQSLWNDAQVEPAEDYNIFNYSGVATGAWVSQKENFVLPFRTYQETNTDTFLPFLGGLTKINEVGEGGAFQIICRPVGSRKKKAIYSALLSLKKGGKLKDVVLPAMKFSLSDFTGAFSPKGEDKTPEKILDEQAIKTLETKIAKPLFEVNVRVLVSAVSKYQADSILNGLAAGFSQFGAPGRNELKTAVPKDIGNLVHQFSFREFNEKQAMILTSEELASLFHFSTSFTEIPRIKYLKAKEAPPPANLSGDGVLIGKSVYRGEEKEIRISDDDRRRHVYIVGQTGTGKTTFITNMAIDDIRRGRGVAVIDPHGDLIEKVLSFVPKNRFDDVIIFDPSDLARPLGLNMIEYDFAKPEQKTFIVNEMVGIFDKLYDLKATGGPMFEQYMRNALLLLMEDEPNEPATLMEVARIFTDAAFRERKLKRIHNPTVIDFWEKEAIKAGGEAALANMTPYITSKFNTFTANDYMRLIIGQAKSAFNFREIMDSGKILLINLSKGKIGDINANLLGMIFVGKILMAALSRVDVSEDKRRDFNLYIDEFQNFTTDSIATILSEARKYRLNLTIAHQFIAQLLEKIRDSVFGNVGSVVAFRVGTQDAEFLVKQFAPVFSEQDLINIDNFNAYVRLLMKGETAKPFNMKIFRIEGGDSQIAASLKEMTRAKYGRGREEVEMEILKRLRE